MNYPLVSVILPIRNEERFIARCLTAILRQDYPPEAMEIIVADGESSDATLEIIRSLPNTERVAIVHNPERIVSTGFNRALADAHGDVILRVDGHAVIATDYVRQSVQALQETNAACVGGCLTPVGLTSTGTAIASAMSSRFGIPSAYHTATQAQRADMVYLGAWPRTVFEQVGGYDTHLRQNQDYEFNYRVRSNVGPIYLTPAIHSEYYGRQDLRALTLQFFKYGKAKPRTLRRHPQSAKPRQLVPPLFVAALILGAALAPAFISIRIGVLALLLLYAALNIGFSLATSRRQRRNAAVFLRLPLIFFLLHASWGVGFWYGIMYGLVAGALHTATSQVGPPTWAQLRNPQAMRMS